MELIRRREIIYLHTQNMLFQNAMGVIYINTVVKQGVGSLIKL